MIFRHIKAKVARNKIFLFWNVFRIYSVSGLDAVAPDDLAVPAPPFLVSYRPFCSGPPLHQHKTQNLQNIVLIFFSMIMYFKYNMGIFETILFIDLENIYCPMSTTMQHVGPPHGSWRPIQFHKKTQRFCFSHIFLCCDLDYPTNFQNPPIRAFRDNIIFPF